MLCAQPKTACAGPGPDKGGRGGAGLELAARREWPGAALETPHLHRPGSAARSAHRAPPTLPPTPRILTLFIAENPPLAPGSNTLVAMETWCPLCMESEGIYHCRTQGRGAPGPGCRNSRGTRESGPGDSLTARRMPQPLAGSPGHRADARPPGRAGPSAARSPERFLAASSFGRRTLDHR